MVRALVELSSTTHSFNVTNQSGASAHSRRQRDDPRRVPTAFSQLTDQYGNTILPGQWVARGRSMYQE